MIKKHITCLTLLSIVLLTLFSPLFSLSLFSDSNNVDPKILESRLTKSTGEKRIELLVKLTQHYRDKNPQKAINYGKEGLKLLENVPNLTHHLAFLNNTAWSYIMLGDYDEAQNYGRRALNLSKQNGDNQGYADALNNIGWAYLSKAEYPAAMDNLTRARELYEAQGRREGIAKALDSIGSVYWKLSDHSNALDSMQKAHNIYEELGDKAGIATMNNNMGVIYWEIKDFDKSLEFYLKSMTAYEALGDEAGVAKTLNNIAIIYHDWGDDNVALQHYQRSLKIKARLGIRLGAANTLNNVGELYYDKKDYHRALEYLSQSLEIKKNINDRKGTAGTLTSIARCNRKLGRLDKALKTAHRSRTLAKEIKVTSEIRDAYLELSEIQAALKNYPKSLSLYKKYKELNDSIFNENNSKRIAKAQARFDLQTKEKEIAVLKKDKQLKQMDLDKQIALKYSLLTISLLGIILVFVIYTRYRLKVKTTRALRKEIEDRKRAEAELLKSEKLEAVGILAGGIAHDFNNLLAMILGNISLASEICSRDTEVKKILKGAEKSSMQAAELAQKLLVFSKGGWILPKETALATILDSSAEYHPGLRPLLRHITIPPDLNHIYGDERQLRQVINNLLKNADEAMAETESKHVSISAENISFSEGNEFKLKEGDYVKISFTDNGRGIHPEHLGKVFDPYFSTKDMGTQKGMGLGLTICYAITKKHGGHIRIRSQEGEGTTVELYLPSHP